MATYTFNSVAEFGRAMQSITPKHRDPDWSGETFEKSLEYAIKGDVRMVAEAEKILDKVQANIETTGRQWQNAVVGNIPSVPDYVMGHPESMRRLTTYESEAAPIRIWVGTNSSASINHEDLRKRGVAVLAAAMALSQSRPVELWTFGTLRGNGEFGECNVQIRINAAPLDLAEACVALASIGFDRNLTHNWGFVKDSFDGRWARELQSKLHDEKACIEGCRQMLGAATEDLIVPPSSNKFSEVISDPVGWVQKILASYGQQEAGA